MLVYMLNNGKLSGIDLDSSMINTEAFKQAKRAKQNHTLDSLCCGKASILKKYAQEVLSLKFKEIPDYQKLHKLLFEAFT